MGSHLRITFTFADAVYPTGTSVEKVAQILEHRYNVVQTFKTAESAFIKQTVQEAYIKKMRAAVKGKSDRFDMAQYIEARLDQRFRRFLSSGAIESMGIPGVPTEASIERVGGMLTWAEARRKKKKINPLASPSFIDTGLYLASFRTKVHDNS